MTGTIYTHATWQVKNGREQAFQDAWEELGRVFGRLEQPPGDGVLMRRVDRPAGYASFGAWPSLAAVEQMRADPDVGAAMAVVRASCDAVDAAAYAVRVSRAAPP